MWIKKIDLKDNEKAFLYKQGRFEKVLSAGRHRFVDLQNELSFERFDTNARNFEHPLAKQLTTTFVTQTANDLEACQLSDFEVGLLYRDGVLSEVLSPGAFRLFWKGVEKLEVKRVDLRVQFEISPELLILLTHCHTPQLSASVAKAVYYSEVKDSHVGLLLVNGKQQAVLAPGNYGFWSFHQQVVVKQVDTRWQNLDVSGQEILTRDRVSLRLNLSATYRVADPALALSKLSDFNDYLYRELQLQLREVVGTRSLDQLLADKNALNQVIAQQICPQLSEFGIEVKSIGLRDIILPGEMKTILNQVVEAEKAAEANLIKRREETAATRSLHNTAKLMEGNPTLMRLKELEVLEKVTERIGNINVYSGLDGVLTDLIKAR